MTDNASVKDYKLRVQRIVRQSFYLVIALTVGILTPFRSIFLGLILGTTVSILNFIYTARKVNRLGEIAVQSNTTHKRKHVFFGFATRVATSILAVMIVYRYPQYFHLFSTLIGLFVVQTIAVIDGLRYRL